MDDSLNICLPCGMCCEGVMIGFVELDKKEIPALKEVMEIEEADGKGFILQPCSSFCEKCTIYSKRPKKCDEFNCGLVKSVEKKELDFNAAIEIIDVVKQKKASIEEKIEVLNIALKSPSFHFKMVELRKIFQKTESESSLTQKHQELKSDIEELDNLMLKRFGVSL